MTFPESLLPNRPIAIERTGVWPGTRRYLGGLLLVGLAAFFGV